MTGLTCAHLCNGLTRIIAVFSSGFAIPDFLPMLYLSVLDRTREERGFFGCRLGQGADAAVAGRNIRR